MIMNKKNISITLYGSIEEADGAWLEWYSYCKLLTTQLGYEPNYIGVISKSFNSGKVVTISRMEKKLMKIIKDNEFIRSLSVYSLPKEFVQAAFDYHTLITRGCVNELHHITLTFPSERYNNLKIEPILNGLKNFINFSNGEIYELPYSECPLFYAAKVNSIEDYKGLRIIRTL